MSRPTVEQLRTVDLFDGLDDEELSEWTAITDLYEVTPGSLVAEQGVLPDHVHLVLTGALEAILMSADGREEPTGTHRAPTWVGAIAALTTGFSSVRMEAIEPSLLGAISRPAFVELVLAQRPVFDRIMRQVRPVVSRITARETEHERLASLGTMAAGLAHELNNPAAAATRAASDLAEALEVISSTIGHFVESGLERDEAEQLVVMQRGLVDHCRSKTALDAVDSLDAADAEDALRDVLDDLGIAESWRIAEPLAAAGVDRAWLEQFSTSAGPATEAGLRWVAATLTARSLAVELTDSTERMSKLVKAVKAYAYMDRGDIVEVDVHEGLETTLTILGHKLKHTQIAVERHYDRNLPKLMVFGSELNQVWTNLLDNAIDALGESGTIMLSTGLDGPCVLVEIADDGPGIPPEVKAHIFDPFFTTKDVGRGTGLGLDTARRIVVDRHRGSIAVETEPGSTTFRVWLPLTQT